MTTRKIILIILGALVLAAVITGLVFLTKNWQKTRLSSEGKTLQKVSEEIGVTKFDLVGKFISASADNSITCQMVSGSKTIEKYKNKEIVIKVSDVTQITDNTGKTIKITDIKSQQDINIRGSIDNNSYQAELIVIP